MRRCAPNTRSTQDWSSSPVRSWIKHRWLLMFAAAAALPVLAQDPAAAYPQRPIRIVIGYSAGGGVDIVPRIVVERLTAKRGQPFLVENRPGASGHIATEIVAEAAPGGCDPPARRPACAPPRLLSWPLPVDRDARYPSTTV